MTNHKNFTYRTFHDFISEHFDTKVQKISINAGFTCPNRDGKKSHGGCTYCNNQTFNPAYCKEEKTITTQIEEGISFFSKKYPKMEYLAYFQAYTNTYGPLEELKKKYEEALSVPGVVGLVIGTRPDCITNELLDYLAELSKKYFVLIEYGLETTNNKTLELINRCHTFEESKETIIRTKQRGLLVGVHMIIGLPLESEQDILKSVKELNKLPIDTIKYHQLQIIKGTKLASQFKENKDFVHIFTVEEYITLVVKIITITKPEIAFERFVSQSPKELLIAPKWDLKNYEFTNKIQNKLKKFNNK